MKKVVIVMAGLIIVLAALSVAQSRKSADRAREVATLKSNLEETAQQLTAAREAQQRLWQEREALKRADDELTARLYEAQKQASTVRPAGLPQPVAMAPASKADSSGKKSPAAGFGEFISSMMKDPEAKKFIREQQRTMIKQLYSPLINRLGLSQESARKFEDLLTDNMMKAAEKGTALFGETSGADRKEKIQQLAADQKKEQEQFDEQVKDFLGDEGFAQYQSYQETVGERTQLNLFRQQNMTGSNPVTDAQVEQLLILMSQEKKAVQAQTPNTFSAPGAPQADLDTMLSDGKTDQFLKSQEEINRRVYQRATAVLLPDQLQSFGKFQNDQVQMMRMSMSMARKLMAPPPPEEPTAPAGQ